MKKFVNGEYVEMTQKEIEQIEEALKNEPTMYEPTREEQLDALILYTQHNLTAAMTSEDDKTLAISCAALFPVWKPGVYKVGDIRVTNSIIKKPYECILDHDSIQNPDYTIDVRTLWKPYHSRQKEYALPWEVPTGSHDIYKAGEYMIWTDGKVYLAKKDTNFSPDVYPQGWELAE